MAAMLYLVGCMMATAQPAVPVKPAAPALAPTPATPRSADWLVAPRITTTQEFVYRGNFSEASTAGGVQFNRAYRVEARVLVLAAPIRGYEVALLTQIKLRDSRSAEEASPAAAKLERAVLEPHGRIVAENAGALAIPLEGPPACESGMFVEAPGGRVRQGQGWETTEPGRPMCLWRCVGAEMINGTSCVKLVARQQSDDWDRPRADSTAWRREETVWLSPRNGLAAKVERTMERREPGREKATWRGVLRYELESSLQYPGVLFEDRRQEVNQAVAFAQSARPLMAAPARQAAALAALQGRIDFHVDRCTPTPYRCAILQVKRQVEAARRGETPPVVAVASAGASKPRVAETGETAPDFVVPFVTHAGPSFQLQRWFGRPILLVFYQPTSATAVEVLRFAEKVAADHPSRVAVFGLAVSGDPDLVRRQWGDLKLTFPLLNGSGLRVTYRLESTPKLVLIDGRGVVRGSYLGWGSETARDVTLELRKWLAKE
jgi:hypothetical protein